MDFVIEDQPTETVTHERAIVPAGRHEMFVKLCEEGTNESKRHETNPHGNCLKLRLATVEGDYRFVFDDIPHHLAWRAANLADALGIKPIDGRLSLSPSDIEGQTLVVEISHYTSKAGKTSAVVKRYVPATVAAKPPAIKPNPKPVVERLPGDDIPFLWLVGLVTAAASMGIV
jgi:cell division septation protein DedD